MVKKDLIEAENWDEIERLTREAVNTMLGFEVKHIGINTENAEEAMKAASCSELMFGFDVAEGNSSIFCGSRAIEIMKSSIWERTATSPSAPTRCLAPSPISRAAASSSTRETASPKAIYFKDEIAGFAVHLVQK